MRLYTVPRAIRRGMLYVMIWGPAALSGQTDQSAQTLPTLRLGSPGRESGLSVSALLSRRTDLKILALRVAFAEDEQLATTGNGRFLMSLDSLAITTVPCDGFLIDPPPHNNAFFSDQLLAMANYFDQTTAGNVSFNLGASSLYPGTTAPITIGAMSSYVPLEEDADSAAILMVNLLADALAVAEAGGVNFADYDVVVLFHAGLGQDFSYPILDPTPRDIPSTYIDQDMILLARGTTTLALPGGSNFSLPAIVVPEGQNHIFYDIAADIFFGQDDLCDVQIGLTGTLTLLMGYALGFPPLFDTDEGTTGVGRFGMMDVGSGNGQGVIPAPPSAWMRTYLGWEVPTELTGSASLTARGRSGGTIRKLSLSNDEYLLIENRLNWITPGVDIDSMLFRDRTENGDGTIFLPRYFDTLVDSAGLTVSDSTGVITALPNYDLGLPASGLLIWHINERRYNAAMSGINNDPNNRAVHLIEADGATDIGFPTTAIFADPTIGWRWDMWYAGNPAWIEANFRIEVDADKTLSLTHDSSPPLRLSGGGETGLEIVAIGRADTAQSLTVVADAEITRLPTGARLLGFNGSDYLWTMSDSVWLGATNLGFALTGEPVVVSEHDADGGGDNFVWVIDAGTNSYVARRYSSTKAFDYMIADSVAIETSRPGAQFPYFHINLLILPTAEVAVSPDPDRLAYKTVDPSSSYEAVALADVDGDGVQEILRGISGIENGRLEVPAVQRSFKFGTPYISLDGFPISGDFHENILVANLIDDSLPEIVTVESGEVAIFSNEGRELMRLGLHADPYDLFLMHLADGRVGLANGDRIHWFAPEEQNRQWVTAQGRHSRLRLSLNDGVVRATQPAVLDKSRVYNYPNPATDGRTTIRFYVGTADKATITIYTIDGIKIVNAEVNSLISNNYSEWVWEIGETPSGLYYGLVEVSGASAESALIKIMVIN